jgi:hypothetical protein
MGADKYFFILRYDVSEELAVSFFVFISEYGCICVPNLKNTSPNTFRNLGVNNRRTVMKDARPLL